MRKELEKIIREHISKGVVMEDIRNELISSGESTEGFTELYKSIIGELGIEEQHAVVHEGSIYSEAELDLGQIEDKDAVVKGKAPGWQNSGWKRTIKIIFTTIVLCAIIFTVVLLKDSIQDSLSEVFKGNEAPKMSLGDTALIVQTDRFQNAAEAYKSKVIDYDDLCRSIGLDTSKFYCNENVEQFVINTRLSTGEYYCVDSTGFSDFISTSREGRTSCIE